MIIGDAFGQQLLSQYRLGQESIELIEREDGYMAIGAMRGLYFQVHEGWSKAEQQAVSVAKGRVLDIGCGAGRHALHLQAKGCDVTAIDLSPGAVKVAKLQGVMSGLIEGTQWQIETIVPEGDANFFAILKKSGT